MVKTTLIVRASDALPLAASVDDEQVSTFPDAAVLRRVPSVCSGTDAFADRERPPGAQATSQTHLPADNTQLGAEVLNRERSVHAPVRVQSRPSYAGRLLTTLVG